MLELEPRSMENDSTAGEVNLSAAAYLLSTVGSVLGNDSVDRTISEVSQTRQICNVIQSCTVILYGLAMLPMLLVYGLCTMYL